MSTTEFIYAGMVFDDLLSAVEVAEKKQSVSAPFATETWEFGRPEYESPEARQLVGVGYDHQDAGEYDEAIECFSRAIELGYMYAHFLRGNCHYKQFLVEGELLAAIDDYTQFIERSPNCKPGHIAYIHRGLCQYLLWLENPANIALAQAACSDYNAGLGLGGKGDNGCISVRQ